MIYGQLIFDKDAKTIQWQKDYPLNNSAGATGYLLEKHQLQSILHITTKINSKGTTDLNIKAKTIKFLGENKKKIFVTSGQAKMS